MPELVRGLPHGAGWHPQQGSTHLTTPRFTLARPGPFLHNIPPFTTPSPSQGSASAGDHHQQACQKTRLALELYRRHARLAPPGEASQRDARGLEWPQGYGIAGTHEACLPGLGSAVPVCFQSKLWRLACSRNPGQPAAGVQQNPFAQPHPWLPSPMPQKKKNIPFVKTVCTNAAGPHLLHNQPLREQSGRHGAAVRFPRRLPERHRLQSALHCKHQRRRLCRFAFSFILLMSF